MAPRSVVVSALVVTLAWGLAPLETTMPRPRTAVVCHEVAEPTEAPTTTEEANPGRQVLDEMTLAKQSADLDALTAKWTRQRELIEWESSKLTGFSEQAEIINGRAAMFFIVTGLLTEYWTGQSIPDQILTLLRITGVVGLE